MRKMFKKKVKIGLVILSLMLLGGCGKNETDDSDAFVATIEQSKNEENPSEIGLQPVEIDYYNKNGLVSSNYMSFILTLSKDSNEAFVSVVDFGSDLTCLTENGFQSVLTDYGQYKFGLGTDEKVAYVGISKYFENRYYRIAQLENTNKAAQIEVVGSWYNTIPEGQDLETAISNMLDSKTCEKSLVKVKDIDDINSVENTYGEEINLSDTVFFNDAVAKLVSESFGLNIRNKESFVQLDQNIIRYENAVFDGQVYVTIVLSHTVMNSDKVETIKKDFKEVSYSYTDNNNVSYEYFSDEDNRKIYVLCNGECVAELTVTCSFAANADSSLKNITYLDYVGTIFGTK